MPDTCPLERYVSERFLPESVEHELWVTTRGKRADVPFIGEARAGAWREKLPLASVAPIQSTWGQLMPTPRMRAEYAAQRALICSEGVTTPRHSLNAEPR